MENNMYMKKPEESKTRIQKKKKTKGLNFVLVFTMLVALALAGYLIYDSFNKINMYWQIINAGFIVVFTFTMILGFKKIYNKKTSLAIIASLIFIIWCVFNGLTMSNILKLPVQSYLPNFVGKEVTKGIAWIEENNKKYEMNYEYSDTVEKFSIIAQDKEAKTLTKNIKDITFTVSNGPNYEKTVIIPNLTGLSIDEAIKIIDENFLNNVTVNFIESNEEKDLVLSQSKTGEMKRNDELILTVSIGKLENLTSITLDNLTNKTEFKATLYLKRNGIKYEITYEFSDKIERGNVISTEPKEGSVVNPGDIVKLVISKGEKIVVPDLNNMTMSEVTKWITENNLSIKYSEKYSNDILLGSVINSNKNKGDIIEEGTVIEIVISKGPLKMGSFKTVNDFKTWASKNNVQYEIKEEFNDTALKDEIISSSVKENENVNLDEKIIITVSKGKSVTVPNMVGKTKSEIEKLCSENKLNCKFNSSYSNSVAKGNSIKQSISSGEKVSENENIIITLSNGKAPAKTSNKTSNSSSNNSSSSSNSSGSKPSSSENNTCDKSKTITVTVQSSLNGTSVDETSQNYRNAYPGVKFNFVTKAQNGGRTGMAHKDNPRTFTANYCDSYTFYIIKN